MYTHTPADRFIPPSLSLIKTNTPRRSVEVEISEGKARALLLLLILLLLPILLLLGKRRGEGVGVLRSEAFLAKALSQGLS
jgi:hypothetical protein